MSKEAPDFLKDKEEEGITNLDMETLEGMIESYDNYLADVERAEKWLKAKKDDLNRISLHALPDFMLNHGKLKR